MRQFILIVFISLIIANFAACTNTTQNNQVSLQDAVSIAKQEAKSKKFDFSNSDIEVLKVTKNGYERGPIRLAAIIRYFPKEKYKSLLDNEYWIIYFYPKGPLDEPHLGGEFHVLVDLHNGKVLESFAGY